MMRKSFTATTLGVLAIAMITVPALAADSDDDKKPKHTIKQVMKEAFKGPLVKNAASGKATKDELKSLTEMLDSLAKSEPKKGEAKSWKKLTGELTKAMKAVNEGDKEGLAALKKAANCKACHTTHK